MSDLRKAAEAVLEAWDWDWSEPRNESLKERMEALRQALAKPEWVGLTDEDLKPLCNQWKIMYGGYVDDFARAIEAKLKEKNT